MIDHDSASSNDHASDYYTPVEDAKDLESCVARAPIPVQLVACVDTVQFSKQEVVLELLTLGASVHAYLPCGNPDAQRCASVALRLLGRGLGLTFPRTPGAPWNVAALPARRLCLVHVHGTLEKCGGETTAPPRVLLEDAAPLDVGGAALSAERYHAAGDRAGGWPQAALYRLFGGLLELDCADASAFAYASLRERPAALDRLVQALRDAREEQEPRVKRQRTIELPVEPPIELPVGLPTEPIELPVPVPVGRTRPVESQFDFNSQAMDTQPPNSPELKPECIDSPESKPAGFDPLTPTDTWEPGELASMREYSRRIVTAVCVGRQEAVDMDYRQVDLYWVPREHDPAVLLEPLHNCIVTTVSARVAAQVADRTQTRLDLMATRRVLAEGPPFSVKLTPLPGSIGILQQGQDSPTPERDSLALPREPFVQFAELQGMQPGEVRYVHMVCLLTNAFQEPLHRYADLELTDFTASALPHKRLYSRRFLGLQDALAQDSSFRAIVYPNQLEELNEEIARELGKGLVQLATDSPHGDLTHLGIVVDLLFKAEVYSGRLSFIVRGGAPVPRHTVEAGKWYAEARPRSCLTTLYSRTREFMQQNGLRLGPAARAAYARFFPGEKTERTAGKRERPSPPPQLIPPLNADTRRYTTVDATGQFPALSAADALACDPERCTLHQLKRLRLLGTRREGNALVLLVTDDLAADDLVPPACVLPLHIVGGPNLRYFVGGDTVDEETGAPVAASLLQGLIGGTFDFQVQPGRVHLSDGAARAVWCPVECTVEEMRAQAARGGRAATAAEARVKQEQY